MPHAHVSRRTSSLRRALLPAIALSLLPLGTAFAQSFPFVRVTHDGTEIRPLRQTNDVRMTAPKGTVLEVIYIEGDRYVHRDSNWYWVLLPQDPWATRPAGWVRGDAVEDAPPPAPVSTPRANRIDVPQAQEARNEPRIEPRLTTMPEPVSVSVAEVPTTPPVYSDVVLNFQFGRSEPLTCMSPRLSPASRADPRLPHAREEILARGLAILDSARVIGSRARGSERGHSESGPEERARRPLRSERHRFERCHRSSFAASASGLLAYGTPRRGSPRHG